MASPGYRNGSPASRLSTPSRSTPNGARRVNGFNSPSRNSVTGSPSLQTLEDYGRVYASKERALKRSLDDQTTEQAAKHFKALDDGLKIHQRVRESAERELQSIILENEAEQRRKEEREKQRIDEARRKLEQQKEDELRRKVEEERAREEDQRRREAARKQEEEDVRKRAAEQQEREREEAVKRQQRGKEESDRKTREEAEAKQKAQQAEQERRAVAKAQAAPPQPPGSISTPAPSTQPSAAQQAQVQGYPAGFVSAPDGIERTHQQYLELHQRLKQTREQVLQDVKALSVQKKAQLTDWRQSINRACGMLRKLDDPETKRSNQDKLRTIQGFLDQAAATTEPMLDVTQYMVTTSPQPPGPYPAQLLYLLHHFAKCIVRQIVAEVSLDPSYGNAIGILAVTVFARPTYHYNGQSLIDVLWAKYHARCPVLFGISANENTAAGRKRMGWHRDKAELPPDQFYLSQRGLGIGFANITLRSFANSKNTNPAPNRIFWQALARILNTPTSAVQPSHFEVLKAIIEHCTPKMTATFGSAAVAMIRQAVDTFPARHQSAGIMQSTGGKSTLVALQSLPHVLRQKYGLRL